MSRLYDTGILTFWGVPNYGTFAQAYALQRALEQVNTYHDVRQIQHLDEYHYNFYYKRYACYKIWNRMYWKEFIFSIIGKKENRARKEIFTRAYDDIPHTTKLSEASMNEIQFNKVFLGSDIIWDFTIDVFRKDPLLFGQYLNANEISSYAASFGTVKTDMPVPDYVKESINNMKYISVRDENSANIVEKLTGKRPLVVLDPVWIWDFENDLKIKKPKQKNYILVYGQDFTDEYIKNLISYAKRKNYQMIALDCNHDSYEWCDLLVKQCNLDPFLWIGYFKYASAIATSTFHGLTFGLVFQKKIAFCKSDFIIAKIGSFLKQIKLYDLFMDENDVYNMLEYQWDYSWIDEFIKKQKEISLEFLKEASK